MSSKEMQKWIDQGVRSLIHSFAAIPIVRQCYAHYPWYLASVIHPACHVLRNLPIVLAVLIVVQL